MKNVIVQSLTPEQKEKAESLLAKNAPPSSSQVYVRGFASDEDIAELRREGLLIEELPAEFSESTHTGLGWLEPLADSAEEFGSLASEGETALPPEMAKLQQEASPVYVVQLKGPIRTAWKEQLANLKVEIVSAKANFALKVSVPKESYEKLKNLEFVARVIPYDISLRQKQMREDMEGAKAVQQIMAAKEYITPAQAAKLKRFELKTQTAEQLTQVGELLKKDARVGNLELGQTRLRFDVDEHSPLLDELAKMSNVVSWVMPFVPAVLANQYVRSAIGVDRGDPPKPLPWRGKGEVIGVADSGVYEDHPDLKPAIKKVNVWALSSTPGDPFGHGTHVCGTIAGRGVEDASVRGVAPDAELVMQTVCDDDGHPNGLPIDLGKLLQEAYDLGARIHNNSWGFLVQGRYSADSLEVDQFIYDHPDMLVIAAAGNEGKQREMPPMLGAIDYQSLLAPGSAKNALTVGACCSSRKDGPHGAQTWSQFAPPFGGPIMGSEPIAGDLQHLAAFSGRGPSDDERVKPDLVAPGTDILSTRSDGCTLGDVWQTNDKYMFLSGTSMATPAVAGAAAIVRQYYREVLKHTPSAALMKATLIGAARWNSCAEGMDATIGQPNYHQGFGRLDLTAILPAPDDTAGLKLLFKDVDRKDPEAVDKGDQEHGKWEAQFSVKAGLPLVVTLAWTDRAAHGLQQDLDLLVRDPAGEVHVGNAGLTKPPWAMGDRKNNVEQVVIANPDEGFYRVIVVAYNTPFEHQGFSVAVSGAVTSDWLP